MSDDRRMDVLRAIVEDYVTTREPVGSKTLSDRHMLGVSPATIRNDMAALEEAGYITQPHTSAGRIPTDKGYRYFVDQLDRIKPLSTAERRAIQNLLTGAVDLDDIIDRTVRALARITNQVAVVQYPSLHRSTLRHVEVVDLGAGRLLLVIIADNGRVEQRVLTVPPDPAADAVARLRGRLNDIVVGHRLEDIRTQLDALVSEFPPEVRQAVRSVRDALIDTLTEVGEERVALAGTSNLARADVEFAGTITPVLEAVEEQVVMLKLLAEMAEGAGEVAVRIGRENTQPAFAETSAVAAGYRAGDQIVGHLAILGPTRMDYPSSIAVVRAVARYLSRILAS